MSERSQATRARRRAEPGRARTRRRASPADWVITLGWAVAGIAVMLVILPLAVLIDGLAVALAGGAILVCLAVFTPKAFALLSIIAIVLSVPLESVVGTLAGYIDEIVILLAVLSFTVRRIVTEKRVIALPGLAWFGGFVTLGLASSVLNGGGVSTTLEGLSLALKGLAFAFALAQLRWTTRDLEILIRAGVVAIAVLVASGIANLLVPGPWSALFAGRPPLPGLGVLPAVSGLFQHPAAFGRLCAVFAVAVLAYRLTVRSSTLNTVLLATTGAFAILTFQVKSIVGLLVTAAVVGARFIRPVGIAIAASLLPLAALFLAPPLIDFVGSDIERYILQDSARSALTFGSLQVASTYFPFGAGFGRYGSFTAATDYSPEYNRLGFENIFGLRSGDGGQFLNDTQWPAILGETGWLGALCFAAGIIAVFISFSRPTSDDEPPLVRWLRVAGSAWLLLLLIESIAAPVFVSAPAYPFVFAAAGVVASIRAASRVGSVAGSPPGLGVPLSRPGSARP